LGPRVDALVVRLPVQVLVLEEQYGVVAADRRSQQSGRIHGVAREDDTDPRTVREDALARLAVVRRAPAQVAADGRPDDHGAAEGVVGAVAQHRELVTN